MATTSFNATQITPPRVPIIDDRTGLVSREWYRYFYSLYAFTGGGTGILPIPSGGTGIGTIPTDGQLLIGDTASSDYKLHVIDTGAGIAITNGAGTILINNTGVLSNIAGSGIGVSSATGNVTVSNTGVLSAIAGSGISVSSATGNVTLANTGVLSFSGGSTGLLPSTATTGAVGLSGTLDVGYGGTGITTIPNNGQIPIGNGTKYTAATLTAGGGIGITNASGSVTIKTSSPTFSAYGNAAQTLTAGVYTKAVLNAEDYDTNNNFDSTTNYRFTPTVAGYYQLNLKLSVASTTSLTTVIADFRKNGSGANNGRALQFGLSLGSFAILNANNIMYFDGSSDYCEIWVYLDGVGTLTISSNDKNTTFFQGSMIRAA